MTVQKKERNIKDEIMASQGGTIASRYQRYEPRKKAIDEINKKWKLNIKLAYYDNLPTNLKDMEDEIEEDISDESEVDENVIS